MKLLQGVLLNRSRSRAKRQRRFTQAKLRSATQRRGKSTKLIQLSGF